MTDRFLDTNIILRHLLNDHPVQSPASTSLIEAIERGQTTVWTTDLAIAEAVFVLSNPREYDLSRGDIADLLQPLIELPGVELPGKERYRRVFALYTTSRIDFIDAFHAEQIEQRDPPELFSYDHHFDRIASVQRFEP